MVKHLIEIQNELKAPKSNYNSFGKYRYRSAEDILTAVKPLLLRYGCQMTLQDDIVAVGDRYYIKATVTITDGTESETVTALAREDEIKKGMDGSQITGTSSSYARKYALNGLFLIDDTKDADTDEYQMQTADTKIGTIKASALLQELNAKGVNIEKLMKQYRVNALEDLTESQHSALIQKLSKVKDANDRKN